VTTMSQELTEKRRGVTTRSISDAGPIVSIIHATSCITASTSDARGPRCSPNTCAELPRRQQLRYQALLPNQGGHSPLPQVQGQAELPYLLPNIAATCRTTRPEVLRQPRCRVQLQRRRLARRPRVAHLRRTQRQARPARRQLIIQWRRVAQRRQKQRRRLRLARLVRRRRVYRQPLRLRCSHECNCSAAP
jgi:hypothetical protein